jgi:outer membrane autotransporter protein
LTPELTFDPNSVLVTLASNGVPFASVGQTSNQISTAAAVQSLGFGNPVAAAVASSSASQARRAFDLLSGEVHASASSVLIDDSYEIRDAVMDRARQLMSGTADPRLATLAPTGPVTSSGQPATGTKQPTYYKVPPVPMTAPENLVFASWAQGFGSWGQIDGSAGAARIDHSTGGFISGIDATFNRTWRVGVAAGHSQTLFDVGDRASSGVSDNYHVALYGGAQLGPWGIRTGAAYTWHDIDTSRTISFPGFADAVQSSYSARTAQVFGEVGYSIVTGIVAIEPFAGLAYVHFDEGAFTEGGGPAALVGGNDSRDVTYTTLGVHAASSYLLKDSTVLIARGTLGWRSAFGDVTPTSNLAFASGGAPFDVTGVPIVRDSAVVQAELDWKIRPNIVLSVTYSGALADKSQDHAVQGGFTVKF